MTPTCSDPSQGLWLHAYELGQLDEELVSSFEAHLLDCDYCHHELVLLHASVSAIRTSPIVRSLVEAGATRASSAWWRRAWEALWPTGPLWLKPAFAYLAVLLLVIPAARALRDRTPGPTGAATLVLSGARSLEVPRAAAGAPVVLYFRVPGPDPEASYRLEIRDHTGASLWSHAAFTGVDRREMGTLLLPAGSLPAGNFTLEIRQADGASLARYEFKLYR